MIGKHVLAVAAGSILMLAAFSAMALAHGFGGPGRGGHEMWLLARAAGLNHSQIASAFENDANLRADRDNLKTTHEAMMTCVVSGKDCGTQITAFSNALQAMAQERMTVWASLLKNAPNAQQAANVYSQLKDLRSKKQQILQNVFGSQPPEASPASGTTSSEG
jgi:hypothetical protein